MSVVMWLASDVVYLNVQQNSVVSTTCVDDCVQTTRYTNDSSDFSDSMHDAWRNGQIQLNLLHGNSWNARFDYPIVVEEVE